MRQRYILKHIQMVHTLHLHSEFRKLNSLIINVQRKLLKTCYVPIIVMKILTSSLCLSGSLSVSISLSLSVSIFLSLPHVCTNTRTHARARAHTHIHTETRTLTGIRTRARACAHTHTHTHKHTLTHIFLPQRKSLSIIQPYLFLQWISRVFPGSTGM